MRIVYITNYFLPVKGGVENHVYYLSREMVKRGHEVFVLCSDRGHQGTIEKKEEVIEGIHVKRFKTWFKLGDFASFWPGAFFAINKMHPDIVSVHVFRNPHNLVPMFTKTPCLLTPHWPDYPRGLRSRFMDFCATTFDFTIGKWILNKYKKILTVTGSPEQDWLMSKFKIPEEKCALTPNGIPSDYLRQRKPTVRKKLNIKKDQVLCVSISRIHKSKGFDQIINIAHDFPEVIFFIAGVDGGFKSTLQTLIQKKKVTNIIMGNEVTEEEKLEAFASADVVIHSSHFEAFGIVIVEAFSQGAPVLTTDQGGMPWVVDDAGVTFEDNNQEAMKQQLTKLVTDTTLRKELSEKARERAKKFTWEEIAKSVENIYKKEIKF